MNDAVWDDIEGAGDALVQRVNTASRAKVLVDLTELNMIGSALVAVIVKMWKAVQKRDGQLVAVHNSEVVYDVLRLAGLHEYWSATSNHAEAYKSLGVSAPKASGLGPAKPSGLMLFCLALGVIAVAAAAAGVALMLSPNPQVAPNQVMLLLGAGGGFGVVLGVVLLLNPALAWLKATGAVIAVGSLACLIVGLINR